jgi:uncharacterized protein YcbK (DUF882 family)
MRRTVIACLIAAAIASPCHAEPGISPAATREDTGEVRRLRLKHHWTGESLEVIYRIGDAYQPEAMAQINYFLRDWRCNKTIEMDPKLIDRIYDLQQRVDAEQPIRVISGYRSEGYNASLLVSGRTVDPESQHMFGRAVDIFVPGLQTERLKNAAEEQGFGGVGHYPFSGPRFIHIDTGPQRHWTEMDPSARRRLGLAKRSHSRFRLNCEMTMADALREISPMDAIAALPPGAAVDPAAAFQTAALARPPVVGDGANMTAQMAPASKGLCESTLPLPALGLLEGPAEPPQPH